jgi:hypothetical protein
MAQKSVDRVVRVFTVRFGSFFFLTFSAQESIPGPQNPYLRIRRRASA